MSLTPAQVLILVLGILLAVSVAGNAWQWHGHDQAVAAEATAKQLNADTAVAAKACGDSVDELATDSKARGSRLERMLAGETGRILQLQNDANEALAARPSNPSDLCASITQYLHGQLKKERAGAKP